MRDIAFDVPGNMTPEKMAQTFAAYLLGSLAFTGGPTFPYGPSKLPGSTDDNAWQLDMTNDFWLHLEGQKATISCRYDGEIPIIEAAVALFKARLCR